MQIPAAQLVSFPARIPIIQIFEVNKRSPMVPLAAMVNDRNRALPIPHTPMRFTALDETIISFPLIDMCGRRLLSPVTATFAVPP